MRYTILQSRGRRDCDSDANKENLNKENIAACRQTECCLCLQGNSLDVFEDELLSLMSRCDLTVPIMQQREAPRTRIKCAIQLLMECFESERTSKRQMESSLTKASNEIIGLQHELECRKADFDLLHNELLRRDEALDDLRAGLEGVIVKQRMGRSAPLSRDSSTQANLLSFPRCNSCYVRKHSLFITIVDHIKELCGICHGLLLQPDAQPGRRRGHYDH
eukprot:758184-Hanusia_phi.AAC.19